MAFAVDLLARKISIEDCPPPKEEKYRSGYEKLNELITPVGNVTETGFLVHEDMRLGLDQSEHFHKNHDHSDLLT